MSASGNAPHQRQHKPRTDPAEQLERDGRTNHGDTPGTFLGDVLQGLRGSPKVLSPKYFYDETGSALFDRICELPEYYVTRTELAIMHAHAPAMGRALGPGVLLVEPGSGSSTKIRLLLDNLEEPAGYVPVEISGDHMLNSVAGLQALYPDLAIHPVCADFTRAFDLPRPRRPVRRRAVYFPGSTIGNFPPAAASGLLRTLHGIAGAGGTLLLGVDLRKDPALLVPAYDDAQGVTAAFNRNLLVRINTELGGNFKPGNFRHRAVWNHGESRIEMHLVSQGSQEVRINAEVFQFKDQEPIVTEYSYKYTVDTMATLAQTAGFRIERQWSDHRGWFSVFHLVACSI